MIFGKKKVGYNHEDGYMWLAFGMKEKEYKQFWVANEKAATDVVTQNRDSEEVETALNFLGLTHTSENKVKVNLLFLGVKQKAKRTASLKFAEKMMGE